MLSISRSVLALVAVVGISNSFVIAKPLTLAPLPLTFAENRGQVPQQYRYVSREGLEALFFSQGVDFVLPARNSRDGKLGLAFLSTSPHTMLTAEQPVKAQTNYLLGADASKFITRVPNYSDVRYQNLYPGITLDFYGNGNNLEHDFTVAPHADPSSISFQFSGAEKIELTSSGDLQIKLEDGTLILKKPVAYQVAYRQRRTIPTEFRQNQDGSFGFHVSAYDKNSPLVIDPVFTFSSYLGGANMDEVAAVTTDSAGNIYLTGTTSSADFPTSNPEQPQLGFDPSGPGGCQNGFVPKLEPTGTPWVYSTYLGGSRQDYGAAIAVDSKGDAIIGGTSVSTNFPAAGSVAPLTCQYNEFCYFVASLQPDGSALNYSGMFGGGEGPYSNNGVMTIDSAGNAYLAGATDSPNFVITPGTLSSAEPGYSETTLFVLKVDPTGQLVYSTLVHGNAPQNPADVTANLFLPNGIAVDAAGQVTVAGTAGPGLPTTAGVVGTSFPNNLNSTDPNAGFVLQLNATASAIHYATYVPGTDLLGGMAVDSSGDVYVAGQTGETNLPVSSNAWLKAPTTGTWGAISSGYIVKLNGQGTSIMAATYVDSTPSGGTNLLGLALDRDANVFVGGGTATSNFPLQNPLISQYEFGDTEYDMVLAEMSSDLSTLKFASYLSSTANVGNGTTFSALTTDPSDNLIVAGTTLARDFPTTPGSIEPQLPPALNPLVENFHSFVSKIDMATPAPSVCPAAWSVTFGQVPALTSSPKTLQITNCGNAPLNISSITSSFATFSGSQACGSVAPGATCAVTISFAPVDDTQSVGTISLVDNAAISPQVIQVVGQGTASDLEASADPLNFGHLVVGTTGPTVPLYLSNNGNASLTISSISLSGSAFSLAQNNCTTVAQYGCTLNLSFSPASAGNFAGFIIIDSNDPVHPHLIISLTGTGDSAYAIPSIGFVLNTINPYPQQTLQINNGSTNLEVDGNNFYPQSIVQLNGVAQQTTFVSNTSLQVTIAASSLTALGEFPLTVVNPAPTGGTSAPITMTTFEQLPFNASALASVPATGLLYAAMPSSDPTNPNTVIPIDPTTGTAGTPIPVGQNPVLLAASSDGAYLYVANATDLTVQRINLQTNAVDRTFPYSPDFECNSCSVPPATDLQTVPGLPDEVVLAQGNEISLYNGSGLVNYVPAAFGSGLPTFDSITFAGNPLALYAEPFTTIQNPFFTTAAITNNGLQYTEVTGTNYGPPSGTGNQVVSDGKLLYTNSGEVWNPSTQQQVGSFSVSNPYQTTSLLTLDPGSNAIYQTGLAFLTTSFAEPYTTIAISSYGQQSLVNQQILTFPQINASGDYNLVRWGSNGFGFIVSSFPGVSGVYILSSNALIGAPQPNPVPVLTSITPAQVQAGSPFSLSLVVNGTGFVPTSVIQWNGSALVTNYVSSEALTATVPAANIASVGTAQVTVANPVPGGGTSSTQVFTIHAAGPAVTLSTSNLSFGSVLQGNFVTHQSITLTNSGSTDLSITSITTTGNFSETNTCGPTLWASFPCQISVTFMPDSAGALTGTLTVTDDAPDSPQTVLLSGTGVSPLSMGSAAGSSMTASVPAGGTATYKMLLTGVTGFSGNVSLSCGGAPAYATCSISPASVNLSGGGSTAFTVTVTTTGSASAAIRRHSDVRLAGFGFAALLLLPLFLQVRKGNRAGSLFLTLTCLLLVVSGCGGSGGNSPSPAQHLITPSGTYSLMITAAAPNTTAQQPLTLIVQ